MISLETHFPFNLVTKFYCIVGFCGFVTTWILHKTVFLAKKRRRRFFSGKMFGREIRKEKRRQRRLWRSPLRISQVSSKGKSRDAGVSVEAFEGHLVDVV